MNSDISIYSAKHFVQIVPIFEIKHTHYIHRSYHIHPLNHQSRFRLQRKQADSTKSYDLYVRIENIVQESTLERVSETLLSLVLCMRKTRSSSDE